MIYHDKMTLKPSKVVKILNYHDKHNLLSRSLLHVKYIKETKKNYYQEYYQNGHQTTEISLRYLRSRPYYLFNSQF